MKTIGEIIKKNNSILTKLINKSQNTKDLSVLFKAMLDTNLAKNCQFANLEDSVIFITVKNAAWATRIRYAIPDILKNLQTQPEFKMVKKIRYSVNNLSSNYEKTKRKKPKISSSNKILWQETLTKLNKKYHNT